MAQQRRLAAAGLAEQAPTTVFVGEHTLQRHAPMQVCDAAHELAGGLSALGVEHLIAAVQLTLMGREGDLDVDGLDGARAAADAEHVGELVELALEQGGVAFAVGAGGRRIVARGWRRRLRGVGRAAQGQGRHAVRRLLVAVAVGDPVEAVPDAEMNAGLAAMGVEL